eukprot:3139190-Pleurochrysis_carterae.AAC.1
MRHIALVAWLGIGRRAHRRLDGARGRHLLAQLPQFVAQRGNIIFSGEALSTHGPAFGVDGVLAHHLVILFEHGEDLDANLIKIVAPGALADLSAGLAHANNIG